MKDFLIVGIVLIIIGVAIVYIIKAKKNGAKCIGCPSGGQCSGAKSDYLECGCGCCSDKQE